jgi:nitrous oxidase accessory protein
VSRGTPSGATGGRSRRWPTRRTIGYERNIFESNAFDVGTNSRSNVSTFAENYWDRYRGYDLDRDGIGDVPHAPVRLFALVVEQTPATLILLRSLLVDLLDLAERVIPALTPRRCWTSARS